jgi:hypothetical protein
MDTKADHAGLADRERIERIARTTMAPPWLRQAIELIAAEAASIAPIEPSRADMPALIYRH